MKKWAKLIDGGLVVFNKNFVHDKENEVYYSNPTEKQIMQVGYKEYIESECTLEEKEGFEITATYEENETAILQNWEYVEISYDCYEDIPVSENDGAVDDVAEETEVEVIEE